MVDISKEGGEVDMEGVLLILNGMEDVAELNIAVGKDGILTLAGKDVMVIQTTQRQTKTETRNWV